MPRIETMKLAIQTGAVGTDSPVRISFNGFVVPLNDPAGTTAPHQVYEGTLSPNSVPHALTLSGPEHGAWDIAGVTVEYTLDGEPPYTVAFGSVRLDATNQLQIWAERPQPAFDV